MGEVLGTSRDIHSDLPGDSGERSVDVVRVRTDDPPPWSTPTVSRSDPVIVEILARVATLERDLAEASQAIKRLVYQQWRGG